MVCYSYLITNREGEKLMTNGAEIIVRFNMRSNEDGEAVHDFFIVVPAWFARLMSVDFTSVEDDESTNKFSKVRLNNCIHEFTSSKYRTEIETFKKYYLQVFNVNKVIFNNVQEDDLHILREMQDMCLQNGTPYEVYVGWRLLLD